MRRGATARQPDDPSARSHLRLQHMLFPHATCDAPSPTHAPLPLQTDDELIPPFARATATALIRETIKDSELKTVLAVL